MAKSTARTEEENQQLHRQGSSWYSRVVLGLIVAATGVGAGDLITASLAGSEVGLVLLWAAVAGAVMKWGLNEGIARWQMATRTTLLEGWVSHLGGMIQWVFFIYFIVWSYSVGGALINACGVAGAGLARLGDLQTSKIIWGILHSLAGLIFVWAGGFKVFQHVMSFLTGLMAAAVLLTVVLIKPDWVEVAKGLSIPTIPRGGAGWLLAVMGGVGGTVTLLCYSYWIREKQRSGRPGMKDCRHDLAVAYSLTAFFGLAMVIIGSRVKVTGRGEAVALVLADQLGLALGPFGRWVFLLGFWGAVFTSLLGVWQGVPYIFADFLQLRRGASSGKVTTNAADLEKSTEYRIFLLALAVIPLSLLWFKVQQVQLVYGILGALFMPFVALTLLLLNNREGLVGHGFRNRWAANLLLAITLGLFTYVGLHEILALLFKP
jgi:Mn2+/Fe2+ NRAMP family transporter